MSREQSKGPSAAPGLTSDQLRALTHRLNLEGKFIEAGFAALRLDSNLQHAPPRQLHDMRLAFFAGAYHLFVSMMGMLDPGTDTTEEDMRQMQKVHAELSAFVQDFELHNSPATGRA